MKHLPVSLLLVMGLLYMQPMKAQDDPEYRMELGGAIGTSFYLGDVNKTWYGHAGMAGAVVGRYLLNPHMAIKGMLSYGSIAGKSRNMKQFYPDDPESGAASPEARVYNFNSSVTDFSVTYEYNFWGYSRYSSYQDYKRLTPYIQLGLGVTYGQAGKSFTANFPIGVGVKYKLRERLNIGLDWSMHFSLSDKLDGLTRPYGIATSGFKNKDHYSFTMIYLTYDLFPKCVNCNKD
jgi:hypothetical protein